MSTTTSGPGDGQLSTVADGDDHAEKRNGNRGQERRVLAACLLGNSIEYYEFFIYGLSASLVFNKLFFPEVSESIGTILALGTFAVAFVARPVGGWFFGHFGDRLGRRAMLIYTLSGMGISTFLIGLLPTAASIGIAAPILLTAIRFLQGFSLGGEASGGFLMVLEHSHANKRGLFTGIVGIGNVCGLILANTAFILVSLLPEDQFLAWGWRIPFLLSALLVAIAMYIRLRLDESPVFEVVKEHEEVISSPSLEVLRTQWRVMILVMFAAMPPSIIFFMGSVFSLSYVKATAATSSQTVMLAVIVTCFVMIFAMPLCGWLSDRTDRRRLLLIGAALMSVTPFIWFPMLGSGNAFLVIVGFLILFTGFALNYGPVNAFFPHLFPANLRYSGVAMSTNFGYLVGAAAAPMVSSYLLTKYDTWMPIAIYMFVMCALAFTATLFLRERADSLDDAIDRRG